MRLYYGWAVVACAMCASIARQGMAVATLSVFIVPMTLEFGWSRTEISGAVSLGSVLGAVTAPWLGRWVDRAGARIMLAVGSLAIAACAVGLSATASLAWFYLFFGLGRMIFAAPFDLGISAAVANWFVRKRARAMATVTVALGVGLALMPYMSQLVMDATSWRQAWLAIACVVLLLGGVPCALFMRRRPEDMGLAPDGDTPRVEGAAAGSDYATDSKASRLARQVEPAYTLKEALATPSFWLLSFYSGAIFAVQAGVSLHQVPHLVERGIDPTSAAAIVAVFSLTVAGSSLGFGYSAGRWPVRYGLSFAAVLLCASALAMRSVAGEASGYVAALLFGAGMGGVLTLQSTVFADYYGRRHFGAIRGVTLPIMVLGQAVGPLGAGWWRDVSGSYETLLAGFAVLSFLCAAVAMLARPPPAGANPT